MRPTPLLGLLSLCTCLTAPGAEALPQPRGALVLSPIGYRGVSLLDGPVKTQYDEVRQWYLNVPNEDYLRDFRVYAGQPATGRQLGGWYVNSGAGMGQVITGLARMYAATGDEACREKAGALLTGWLECVRPDGSSVNSTAPYPYEKSACALLDMATLCGDDRALPLLGRLTDWAIAHFDRARKFGDNGTEWYTLSENLYRAWLLTGESKYLDFAREWEYREFWDLYATKTDILTRTPAAGMFPEFFHAFSHTNTLCGAAMAYRVTGDPYYRRVIENAYDYLQERQVFATGGFGAWWEHFLPKELQVEALTGDLHDSCETHCDSWAVYKLCKHLLTLAGKARYGDWLERVSVNLIGATLANAPDGRSTYYSDYNAGGGTKFRSEIPWTCCTGTRASTVSEITDLIYFTAPDGLRVNLFIPSTVTWRQGAGEVTVAQVTRFPEEPVTRLQITDGAPTEFALGLRVPGWLAGPLTATVNGAAVDLSTDEAGWAGLTREWRPGDELVVKLPMSLWVSRLAPETSPLGALMIGPVVLAARSEDDPSASIDLARLDESLVPTGEPLSWRLAKAPEVLVRPYYAFGEGVKYFLYLDTGAGSTAP